MIQFSAKTAWMAFAALLLFGNADWVTDSAASPASPASMAALVKKADDAYRNLPGSITTYNLAMRELCLELEVESPGQFASNLRRLGAEFDSPKVALPLRRIQIAAFSPGSDGKQIGVPLVVGYETKDAPLYPPEGLFVDGTAIYERASGHAKFLIVSHKDDVLLNGRSYALADKSQCSRRSLKAQGKTSRGLGVCGHGPSALSTPEAADLSPGSV